MAKKKAAKTKRKGGGGKLARTENVQVRLDPKLKFAAELAARKQRRTLSSFVEWAVAEAVQQIVVGKEKHENAFTVMNELWSPYEFIRFANLVKYYPHFLTYEEEIHWQDICRLQSYWIKHDIIDAGCSLKELDRNAILDTEPIYKEIQMYLNGEMDLDEFKKFLTAREKAFAEEVKREKEAFEKFLNKNP